MPTIRTILPDRFNALAFKYRGLLWGIFAVLVLVLPSSYDDIRTAIAIPLLIGGQALRFWAAGLIQKYRTLTLDAPILVTEGPYSIVRNPLYLGNGMMGCGWAILLGWAWLPAFAIAFVILYSLVIIPYEESFLTDKFGVGYEEYRASTPQLFPAPSLYKRPTRVKFDAQRSWSMERHSLRMNVLVTILAAAKLWYVS